MYSLVLPEKTIECNSLQDCMSISNSMTMAERKEYLNIYIAKNNSIAYLKKDGKEIQINLQKLKSIFEISSWLQLRGYPDMCIKIPSLSIM